MTVPHVTNWFEAIIAGVTAGLITLLSFIPALIGAILLLIIGWILSGWIAKLVTALLTRVGFNTAAERTGVTGFMRQSGMRNPSAAWVLAEIVKWFIRLIFIEMAAQALQLQAVTTLINSILLWIPHLVVAIVVLMIGALIARFVGDLVRGAAAEGGFGSPGVLSGVARFAILGFAVLVAVNEIGIAANLVQELFIAIVAALALAVGLAFGLGGREVAADITRNWYQQRGQAGQLLQSAGRRQTGSGAGVGGPEQTTGTPPTGTTADVTGTTVRARPPRREI